LFRSSTDISTHQRPRQARRGRFYSTITNHLTLGDFFLFPPSKLGAGALSFALGPFFSCTTPKEIAAMTENSKGKRDLGVHVDPVPFHRPVQI
jgi:hypothetical protein